MNNLNEKNIDYIMDQLDRYIFLMELSILVLNQGEKAYVFKCKSNEDFMQSIEYIMNYLNTVYTIKEFASSFSWEDEVNRIQNTYYKQNHWYKFTIEYRNCAVHSFALPRTYNPEDGELVINIDDLIAKQSVLLGNERNEKKKDQITGRINTLSAFKSTFTPIFPASEFIVRSLKQVLCMTTKMLHAEFNAVTRSALIELINHKELNTNLNISLMLENFYVNSKYKLANNEDLFKEIHKLFAENSYTKFKHYDSTRWF